MNEYKNAQYDKCIEELETKILPLLPSFAKDYFIKIRNDGKTALTQLEYSRDILSFFKYIKENIASLKAKEIQEITLKDLEKIRPKDIEYYMANLQVNRREKGKKNSPVTIKRKVCAIKSFYKYFYRSEEIFYNPAELVDLPKLKKKEIIRLDEGEMAEIMDVAESGSGLSERTLKFHKKNGVRDSAIMAVFLGTGMRVSELVGLDIDDYNIRDKCFHITRKGNKEDKVYYGDEVEAAMKAYLIERQSIIPKDGNEDALFLSNRGTRITVRNVEYMVKKYGDLVTTKGVHPHTLRKSYGSMLYSETNDIYLTASVLGHENVEVTKNAYAVMPEEKKRSAAGKVVIREASPVSEPSTPTSKEKRKAKTYTASDMTGLGQTIAEKTKINTYIELVKEGLLTEEKAAEKAGMDVEDFIKLIR